MVVDMDSALVTAKVSGALTYADVETYIAQLHTHQGLPPAPWIEVLDLEGAEAIDLSFMALHRLRSQRLALPDIGCAATAILAPTALAYGISRIFQTLLENEGRRTTVSRDRRQLREDITALRATLLDDGRSKGA